MIEARIFTDSLDEAKTILTAQKAINKGRYKIIDEIFQSTDPSIPLIEEFLRLRVLPENIWDDKAVVLAIKTTELQAVGKNSDVPLRLQFDKKDDAETYYTQHLSNDYTTAFSFSRIGWQYIMPNGNVVDLEIIDDKYPSIEFKSQTSDGIEKLLSLFGISNEEVITGPSVVAVKELLKL
ncbi:MAG: hypothetical protein JWP06_370 [Candidatus Saccharibacteria bacterium]|nr:hypothetical protein [Candidatus Saccharibacteria bacterium]